MTRYITMNYQIGFIIESNAYHYLVDKFFLKIKLKTFFGVITNLCILHRCYFNTYSHLYTKSNILTVMQLDKNVSEDNMRLVTKCTQQYVQYICWHTKVQLWSRRHIKNHPVYFCRRNFHKTVILKSEKKTRSNLYYKKYTSHVVCVVVIIYDLLSC